MDRVGLLHQLATLPEHPESVPINALVAVKGTPLQVWLCILHLVTRSPLWMHVVEVKAPTKSLRVNLGFQKIRSTALKSIVPRRIKRLHRPLTSSDA